MAASSFSRTALEPMPCVSWSPCRLGRRAPPPPAVGRVAQAGPVSGSCDDSHAFLVGELGGPVMTPDIGWRSPLRARTWGLTPAPRTPAASAEQPGQYARGRRPLANPPGGVGRSPTGPAAAGVLLVDLRDPAGAHGAAAFTDREPQLLLHGDRLDQLDRHLRGVPR